MSPSVAPKRTLPNVDGPPESRARSPRLLHSLHLSFDLGVRKPMHKLRRPRRDSRLLLRRGALANVDLRV